MEPSDIPHNDLNEPWPLPEIPIISNSYITFDPADYQPFRDFIRQYSQSVVDIPWDDPRLAKYIPATITEAPPTIEDVIRSDKPHTLWNDFFDRLSRFREAVDAQLTQDLYEAASHPALLTHKPDAKPKAVFQKVEKVAPSSD